MGRWLGVHVSGDKVTVVDAEVPADDSPMEIISDNTFTLQKGERAHAYRVMYDRINNYAKEHGIYKAIIKESALPLKGSPKLSLLQSAELRGVVMAALSSACDAKTVSKGSISKGFGERKVDEYLKDEDFWDDEADGKELRSGSREAALLIMAERKKSVKK